jgi:hypothetical protein
MENNWHTYDTEVLIWEIHLPSHPSDREYQRWERTVLDAGEAHDVYRVQRTGEPERLLFSASVGLRGTSRLAYVETTDQIREHDVVYVTELPGLKTQFGQHLKSQPPLQFMSDLGDDGVYVWACSHTTIWLPWQPNNGLYDDLPDEALIDNRALAERHTPRLNAFLADIGDAARAAGGRMRLDRTDTSRDYLPFVDDNGVRLDIPDGAAGRLVG